MQREVVHPDHLCHLDTIAKSVIDVCVDHYGCFVYGYRHRVVAVVVVVVVAATAVVVVVVVVVVVASDVVVVVVVVVAVVVVVPTTINVIHVCLDCCCP